MVNLILLLTFSIPQEDRYFEIIDVPIPHNITLEVGGLLQTQKALYIATRRGEIWKTKNPLDKNPVFQKWAEGLQEPLGLLEHDGWLWTVQRGELSRMRDINNDNIMDELETIADGWHLSGNYHEYAFGPILAPDDHFWINLNKPFGNEPFGKAPWRGWALRINSTTGKWQGAVAGLRSPAGIGLSPSGEVFFSDNQGEWCATSKFSAMSIGEFHGHPWGIDSCELPQSAVKHPGLVTDGPSVIEASKTIRGYTLPSVWIPFDLCGRSPGGFVWDTEGHFGPYKDQVLIGDQYSAEVFRVDLEKVNNRWQGACFALRSGLKAGITRVAWATDGSLWCGMTTRGWPSLGTTTEGLQRIQWTGEIPFDLLRIRALSDGFRLEFTSPVAPESLNSENFSLRSWTYHHWSTYGSPPIDEEELAITSLILSDDGKHIDLKVPNLRIGFVHEIEINQLKSQSNLDLLHNAGWYTLNAIPKKKSGARKAAN